ncbi:hypothetical protein C900_05505 [Fulvivirga imtechensis AK7]|uniref:Uncharacterized protein n=1 Tax=Fulvivirga imtechensis AK7 TaxID=1237149 RepID=L8JJN0_9BACT|nr:hypothetical protein C900_05505 [Fulvivirga imtechensis AK7]
MSNVRSLTDIDHIFCMPGDGIFVKVKMGTGLFETNLNNTTCFENN